MERDEILIPIHSFEIICNDKLLATAETESEARNYFNYECKKLDEDYNNDRIDYIDLYIRDINKDCKIIEYVR